jgi:hypothetical protein
MKMPYLIFILFLLLTIQNADAQFYSDYEAKSYLRESVVYSSNMITNAEKITIDGCEIKPVGGISIDLPILECVTQDEVMLLEGAEGYITSKGTIIIEATGLSIDAVYYKGYLIVADSLKTIANWIVSG